MMMMMDWKGEDFIVGSVFREERGVRREGGWTVGKCMVHMECY